MHILKAPFTYILYLPVKHHTGTLRHGTCRNMSNTKFLKTLNEPNISQVTYTQSISYPDIFDLISFICISCV